MKRALYWFFTVLGAWTSIKLMTVYSWDPTVYNLVWSVLNYVSAVYFSYRLDRTTVSHG